MRYCGSNEKREVFLFCSRYTQGDKLRIFLGGILGVTTTKS
jgi:hypothetical protein